MSQRNEAYWARIKLASELALREVQNGLREVASAVTDTEPGIAISCNPCHDRRDACDPRCPGWALFNAHTAGEGIQRCDECARFESDTAAIVHTYECEHCAREAAAQWRETL